MSGEIGDPKTGDNAIHQDQSLNKTEMFLSHPLWKGTPQKPLQMHQNRNMIQETPEHTARGTAKLLILLKKIRIQKNPQPLQKTTKGEGGQKAQARDTTQDKRNTRESRITINVPV